MLSIKPNGAAFCKRKQFIYKCKRLLVIKKNHCSLSNNFLVKPFVYDVSTIISNIIVLGGRSKMILQKYVSLFLLLKTER